MNQKLLEELYGIVGREQVKTEELMCRHTTFRIGGPAEVFVTPNTVEELSRVIRACNSMQIPYYILGHGSNLLIKDEGLKGVVIQLYRNFSSYSVEGNIVKAQAGVMLQRLGNEVLNAGLAGFEFAAGIPGTVGGAIVMNAGAYGGEMKDIVSEVQLMDREGNVFERMGSEMDFGYRHSIVEERGYIVLGATFALKPGDPLVIKDKMDELALARRSKQPLEYPSAGSTFKRPEGYFAGKLIMDAGLRGYSVGDAQVSEKHCGFVINKGEAKAADVLQLIENVKHTVYEKFQVELEPEVKIL